MHRKISFYKPIPDNVFMSTLKNTGAEQFLSETQGWGRTLDFYKQENAFLKTRLSQVVDHNSDKTFVAAAENFNNKFLITDEYISDLGRDVRLQLDIIKQALNGDAEQEKLMQLRQRKLRGEMERFEKEVCSLRTDFNKRLVAYYETN